MTRSGRAAKRALDLTAATVGLVVLSPVLLVVAVLCRLRHRRGVLHRSERAGRDGRAFVFYKFRTMNDARSTDGTLLPDHERLTALGRALRSSSLDELPQLWNIVRGDMSLVGPRPLPTTYLPRYTPEERHRHDLRPGLTGWAQVHGRNAVDWDDRLALDVWYVRNQSVWLDLRILARTLVLVFRRKGISAEGEATMRDLRPERAERS